MSVVAGYIQIAHRTDAQNLVPAVIFLKHFQHFFLLHHLFQFGRVFTAGDTQQQSVVVFYNVEQADVSCTGYQAAIITVHRVAQLIVVRIKLTVSVQQSCLIHHPSFFEQTNHFLRVTFSACVGNIGRDDFLHFLFDALYVIQSNGTVNMQFAEISL